MRCALDAHLFFFAYFSGIIASDGENMKPYFLTALFVLALGVATTPAQRCGDDLWLYVRDSESRVILPKAFDSVRVRVDSHTDEVLDERDLIEVPTGIRSFVIPTGCGVRLVRISIVYEGREMILEVRNVAGDSGNILLESVPFRTGTFLLDLKRWERDGCDFEAAIEEPMAVRGGSGLCVIHPSKWKNAKDKPATKDKPLSR